ncbi:hypothetical protein [Castellaniella sp.]|uniref:hypothetical protein n=1 Tax=Castellaniella sp. TaxID=1955812 RepID=UPI002AFE0538|nr:hypothetical protein [Castellaniella sp.]
MKKFAKPWQGMESAPHDRPILAFVDDSSAPYEEESGILTVYRAHTEAFGGATTGFHIIRWGGEYDGGEDEGYCHIPDWWFVDDGGDFETPAYPICWMSIPDVYKGVGQ